MKQCSIYNAPIKNVQPKEHIDFVALVELIRGDTYKERTKKLRAFSDGDYKAFKNENLDHVTFAGTFTTRNNSGLVEPSGLMVFDIDDLENPEWHKEKISRDTLVEIALIFTSPSGKGLKIVVWVDLSEGNHAQHYPTIKDHFENEYNLTVDHAPDAARTCFLCHDPIAYVNESFLSEWPTESFTRLPVRKFNSNLEMTVPIKKSKLTKRERLKINYIIDQLEKSRIDLTESEPEWSKLRFAFASLGEEGRPFFHRLSSIYPEYSEKETDDKFDKGLQKYSPIIDIDYFFNKAREAGIQTERIPYDKLLFESFFKENLEHVPKILMPSIDYLITPTEKFLFLLSVITSVSGFIPNIYSIIKGKRIRPNHFLIITGPSSVGKSASNLAKPFMKGFEEWLHKRYEIRPFITANNSSANILKVLENTKGCGVVFATEIDTLTKTINQEWGDYSDLLRNGYDNVSEEAGRMEKHRQSFVKQLNFSLLLSGTQNQLYKLIADSENGLLSRLLFIELSMHRELRNPFEESKDYDEMLVREGEALSELLNRKLE
jgi:hypothetical protein